MFGRNKIAMVVAEFFGAATLSMAMFSMIGRTNFPFFSGLAAAATMAAMVLVIGATSGAHINPAVTFGMWTIRKIRTIEAIAYIAAQMLGGLAAWRLAVYFIHSNLKNSSTGPFSWRVLAAEAVGTFIFTFGFAAAVYQGIENNRRAAVIGLSLFAGILAASLAANGILNPAVALGIQSWSRAYVVGPLIGSLVGMNLYSFLFAPRPVRAAAVKAATTPAKKRTTARTKKSRR